jgi:hypothetical protein
MNAVRRGRCGDPSIGGRPETLLKNSCRHTIADRKFSGGFYRGYSMRNATGVLAAAMLIILCLGWVPVRAENEMRVPMGEITLKTLTTKAKRSPVIFPHAVHFDYNCRQCHHKWDKEAPIRSCTTAGCHDFAEMPKNEKGRPVSDTAVQIRYYKNAFHQMCIECHLQIARSNEKLEASRMPGTVKIAPAGPTGCIQCHPKK